LQEDVIIVILMSTIIVAGACLMIAAMMNQRRMREMAHRERIAMIDRGLIPSPERDPAGFEAASGLKRRRESSAATNYRTSGIILIGIGFGLMILITFTVGSPAVGFGVGGAWVALGAALLLNYFLMTRRDEPADFGMPRNWTPPPPREPPSNIAP
jgi:hypothetical protein